MSFSYPLPEYWYAFSWQNWVTVPSADCKLLTEFLLPRPFKFSITFPTVPGLARFEPRTFILRILRPRHLRHGDPNCKLRFELNQFELTTCRRVKKSIIALLVSKERHASLLFRNGKKLMRKIFFAFRWAWASLLTRFNPDPVLWFLFFFYFFFNLVVFSVSLVRRVPD